jgi:catechol 2,3-dioxygenase-like lactoylglutathione lyase family enzyme
MGVKITKDSIDLGIVTTDAAPMLTFYRDTLGLEVAGEMDMPGGGHMTRLACGTTTLKLVVNGKPPVASAPTGGIGGATGLRYLTISVSNLEEATSELDTAGYHVVIKPREIRAGVMISMIEDPDGNWVELLQMS